MVYTGTESCSTSIPPSVADQTFKISVPVRRPLASGLIVDCIVAPIYHWFTTSVVLPTFPPEFYCASEIRFELMVFLSLFLLTTPPAANGTLRGLVFILLFNDLSDEPQSQQAGGLLLLRCSLMQGHRNGEYITLFFPGCESGRSF